MKRIVFVFFMFVVSVTFAQKFHGGFFAGIAASQISGDQLAGFDKPGWYAGGFTNYSFTEKSALQFEIYYILKGSSKNPRPKNNDYVIYKLNLHYVEIPLLYKWSFSFPKFKVFKNYYLEAGPALGVLLKTYNVEKDAGGLVPNFQRPEFNRFDYSVIGGLGVHIMKHLNANIRFENSFLPVRKPELGTSWRLYRWQYNSSITISAIYEI